MYGTTEEVKLRESVPFQAGVTSNVKITKIAFENAKEDGTSDKTVIAIYLEGPNGEKFRQTEWLQNEADKMKNQMVRLKRWVKETNGNNFPTNHNSWEDCAKSFIDFMNGYQNELYQVKFLYGTKYLEIPKYDPTVRNMKNPTLSLSTSDQAKLTKPQVQASTDADLNSISAETLDF
jgi:hypothetical protein